MIRAGSRAFRITTTSSGFARLKYGSTNSSRRPGGAEASSTDDAQIQASPDAARLYDEAINARALDSPRMEASMPRPMIANLIALAVTLILAGSPAEAADGDQVDTVTQQVERGSKKVGEGISETVSDIGHTIVEGTDAAAKTVTVGAKRTGRVIGRAGRTVGHGATAAWETVRDRLIDFGDEVVRVLKRPF